MVLDLNKKQYGMNRDSLLALEFSDFIFFS